MIVLLGPSPRASGGGHSTTLDTSWDIPRPLPQLTSILVKSLGVLAKPKTGARDLRLRGYFLDLDMSHFLPTTHLSIQSSNTTHNRFLNANRLSLRINIVRKVPL